MQTYKQFVSEVKADPLHHTDSTKLSAHIHKNYGGIKRTNLSTPGANFTTHTTSLTKEGKEKLGSDLKKAGWKYSTETNKAGDVVHRFEHPTEKSTTVVHVDHKPGGINSHLSNHVVTKSYKEPKRSKNYIQYD